ncbi:MAG TPA: glycosyltransferase family 9 protein, partial [Chthoniobacterales bacterium]
ARILLTVDSAPMHLASAVETAQVVLFGPTNPFHWRPRFAPAAILQGGVDGPLMDFSPERRPVPMKEISTGQVINAMESLLSATAATAL